MPWLAESRGMGRSSLNRSGLDTSLSMWYGSHFEGVSGSRPQNSGSCGRCQREARSRRRWWLQGLFWSLYLGDVMPAQQPCSSVSFLFSTISRAPTPIETEGWNFAGLEAFDGTRSCCALPGHPPMFTGRIIGYQQIHRSLFRGSRNYHLRACQSRNASLLTGAHHPDGWRQDRLLCLILWDRSKLTALQSVEAGFKAAPSLAHRPATRPSWGRARFPPSTADLMWGKANEARADRGDWLEPLLGRLETRRGLADV